MLVRFTSADLFYVVYTQLNEIRNKKSAELGFCYYVVSFTEIPFKSSCIIYRLCLIELRGFPKKAPVFSIKNIINLLSDDKEGKIMKNIEF